jgi:hypothetical protein
MVVKKIVKKNTEAIPKPLLKKIVANKFKILFLLLILTVGLKKGLKIKEIYEKHMGELSKLFKNANEINAVYDTVLRPLLSEQLQTEDIAHISKEKAGKYIETIKMINGVAKKYGDDTKLSFIEKQIKYIIGGLIVTDNSQEPKMDENKIKSQLAINILGNKNENKQSVVSTILDFVKPKRNNRKRSDSSDDIFFDANE